jgi:mono/diheme cytochrome c family protein
MTVRKTCLAVFGPLPMAAVGAVLVVVLTASAAAAQDRGDARRGAQLAAANCGECHALDAGKSPLADAPPFATLHRRYPPGAGLGALLSEGMIAPVTPLDEGGRPFHPRMPQVKLDDGQVADLIAFLRSVQTPAADKP